jgi:GT2 family glycosyltransferase
MKNEATGISVIIPNYNGAAILPKCLDAVYAQQDVEFEVILVDDCSTDDSHTILGRYVQDYGLKVISNAVNIGYAGSCANGTKIAKYNYYLFLNSDAYLQGPRFLTTLLSKFYSQTNLAVAGCLQLNVNGTVQFYGTNLDLFLNIINRVERKQNIKDFPGQQSYMMVGGASYAISKVAYVEVSGIDPTYYLYVEELDLMWRLRLAGYDLATFFDLQVIHEGKSSTGNMYNITTSANKIFLRERNTIITMLKNYSLMNLIWILPIHNLLQFCEMVIFTLTGRPRLALSYIKAWVNILKGLSDIKDKRFTVQKNRKCSDVYLFKNGYIMLTNYKLRYYIKHGLLKAIKQK